MIKLLGDFVSISRSITGGRGGSIKQRHRKGKQFLQKEEYGQSGKN